MANTALLAPEQHFMEPISFDMAQLRQALRNQLKVYFEYRNAVGAASSRTVRPLSLAYFGPVWLLAAWCELREDFRTFRLDRIDNFLVRTDRFRGEPGKTLADFLRRPQTWTRGASSASDT
jgi:predicted DNA-binding transcriptional regulator YafY